MLPSLALILFCQLLGDLLGAALSLPLPGAVLGMALLTLGLALGKRRPKALDATAGGLLTLMPLFFIPAGVGVIELGARLEREWLPMLASLVGSTVLAMTVTALTMKALLRSSARVAGRATRDGAAE